MKKNSELKIEISESVRLIRNLIVIEKEIYKAINKIYKTFKKGGKVFICGNGGSAADAQHLSAEFLVRLNPRKNRKPIPIISLAMDTSTLTACGNDYGFKYIFSRNLEALSNKNDILIVISTSGNSENIREVLKLSKKKKIFSIAFLGSNGGKAKELSNLNLIVPSSKVSKIQECHIFIGHFILNRVEEMLFPNT
jgi:D-sedoheptulose 7-phosphate isomerase